MSPMLGLMITYSPLHHYFFLSLFTSHTDTHTHTHTQTHTHTHTRIPHSFRGAHKYTNLNPVHICPYTHKPPINLAFFHVTIYICRYTYIPTCSQHTSYSLARVCVCVCAHVCVCV